MTIVYILLIVGIIMSSHMKLTGINRNIGILLLSISMSIMTIYADDLYEPSLSKQETKI